MAETITPVVHGRKRGPYLVSSLLHILGATLAAAAFGLLLGGIGALLPESSRETAALAVGIPAFVYLTREAFGVPVPLPDRKRQVPEWWRTFFSPPVAAFLYGLGLGVGVLTYLTFGTFAAVMVAAVAAGDPLTAVLLCAPFGLARGVAVAAVTRAETAVDRLDAMAEGRGPRLANAAALAGVAGAALATAL